MRVSYLEYEGIEPTNVLEIVSSKQILQQSNSSSLILHHLKSQHREIEKLDIHPSVSQQERTLIIDRLSQQACEKLQLSVTGEDGFSREVDLEDNTLMNDSSITKACVEESSGIADTLLLNID